MNRIEFMTELAALLQDISVEERTEAMQYYNDYFDDAGEENEQKIIGELGSPAKVAAEVKAGLGSQAGSSAEYRETGYTDTRFEQKETPADKGQAGQYSSGQEARRTSSTLKITLIVLIVLIGLPIVLPVGIALMCVLVVMAAAVFILFASLVIVSIALAIAGICIFCAGIATLVPELAVGLALIGTGLLLTVIGVIATVAATRLCIIVLPGMFRGIVWLCRKPFERRAVA